MTSKAAIARIVKAAKANPYTSILIDTGRKFWVSWHPAHPNYPASYFVCSNNPHSAGPLVAGSIESTVKSIAGAPLGISAVFDDVEVTPSGNWNGPGDFIPNITIDQWNRRLIVRFFNTERYQKKATVQTLVPIIDVSKDGQFAFIRGEVTVKNHKNYKTSGTQGFCFACEVKSDGFVAVHRTPATKGWMDASPEEIPARLRKLGY